MAAALDALPNNQPDGEGKATNSYYYHHLLLPPPTTTTTTTTTTAAICAFANLVADILTITPRSLVAIILSSRSALPDSAAVPERRLVLTREVPSIRVGRASKVPTKGFIAAKENAWFDSPVMSRQHAEIIANFNTNPKTVMIQDIGSLHGTFHTPNDGLKRETRLEPQKPVKLATGDILRFGIDIFRSKETFPPCSVDFLMEEKTQPPTTSSKGTFSVPDDIDEDDMDYMSEISESDMVFDVQPDGRVLIPHSSPQAPSRVASRHTLSIDLTGEDTGPSNAPNPVCNGPVSNKSDFIDLTSEPDQDPDPVLDASTPNPPVRRVAQRAPAIMPPTTRVGDSDLGMQQPDLSFETDSTSDRDEVGFRVDFGDESDNEELLRIASSDFGSPASEDSDMGDSDDNENDRHEPTLSEFGDELADALDAFEEAEDSLNKTPYYEDSESSSGDDVHDTMLDSPPSKSTPSTSSKPTVHSFNTQNSVPSRFAKSSPSPSSLFAPASFSASIASSVPQARQPSPSDAAMFKSRPILNRPPSISRAQALGEKTGKFEYFAARENNRAAMSHHEAAVPVSSVRKTLQPDTSGPSKNYPAEAGEPQPTSTSAPPEVSTSDTTSEVQDNTAPVSLRASSSTQDSAWSASGERFINNPRTDELPPLSTDRAHSPDLDMTSAYTFQQSKLATEARARQGIRRLPIQDLLAQEPKDPSTEGPAPGDSKLPRLYEMERSPAGTKRSFEDAFDGNEEPIAEDVSHKRWDGRKVRFGPPAGFTTQSLTPSHPTRGDVPVQEAVSSNLLSTSNPTGESQEAVVISAQKTDRPSKRLRLAKAAAYVSCAALGGAAAFSVLVSTAPF
ncbi:hypothetical protein F5X99DRAFT_414615 [Biscogniauxia marginata]|nr:hypothetical protein F5X99DRAFT_414615 [Biscogniauxia marginata]